MAPPFTFDQPGEGNGLEDLGLRIGAQRFDLDIFGIKLSRPSSRIWAFTTVYDPALHAGLLAAFYQNGATVSMDETTMTLAANVRLPTHRTALEATLHRCGAIGSTTTPIAGRGCVRSGPARGRMGSLKWSRMSCAKLPARDFFSDRVDSMPDCPVIFPQRSVFHARISDNSRSFPVHGTCPC